MTAPVIENRRPGPGRLAGFAVLLVTVSWALGALAAHPWVASPPGAAMIRVAFKHVAAFEQQQSARSKAEIDQLPRHMRPTSAEAVRTGRRVRTVLRVEVDDRVLLERRYAPGGLRHDGPTFAYEEMGVRPGRHRLRVTISDEAGATGAPRQWQLEEDVSIASGDAVLIEFSEDTGLVRRGRAAVTPARASLQNVSPARPGDRPKETRHERYHHEPGSTA
jgi:hypothetical protein